MCRLHTEGIHYGCGHYIVTGHVDKADCHDRFCMNSVDHPQGRCNGCGNTCKRYYDPDKTQNIIHMTTAYCNLCEYWYKGPGAKREANPVPLAGGDVLLTMLGDAEPQRRDVLLTMLDDAEPQRRPAI